MMVNKGNKSFGLTFCGKYITIISVRMRCIMKVSILVAVSFFCCVVSANATYDYIVEDGYASLTLEDDETLLMTGGGASFEFV